MKKLKSRIELAQYFHELGFTKGAEIGVAGGRYSEILCDCNPALELLCVDPWGKYRNNRRGGNQEQHDRNYEQSKKRLSRFKAILLKMTSVEASLPIEDNSLDFVFLDGNHDYDYVMEDIITWSRKVKKGGIISLHDYYNFNNSGVIEAVDDYVKYHKIDLQIIPFIEGVKYQTRDDKHPCAWWIK